MKPKKNVNSLQSDKVLKEFIQTKEFKKIIQNTIPEIIDMWSGKSRFKKLITKPVKKNIRKNFNGEKHGSQSLNELLNDPEVIKKISQQIPSLVNLIFESIQTMSHTISEMSDVDKTEIMDNIIENIEFSKSGLTLTNLLKLINDVHKINPHYFEEKLRPQFRGWVENFDFGELKECVDNSSDDIVNIVSMINQELWNYPAKFLCIFSLIPGALNIILESLNRTMAPINGLAPDLLADVILALMEEIQSEKIGETINQVNEIIRKIHTGSALIGEKGNPQFPVILKTFLSNMFEKIDMDLLIKSRGKLEEIKDQAFNAYIEVLSEKPGLSRDFIQNQFKALTTSSKKLGSRTDTLEKLFSDDELAEEFSIAATEIDVRDFAENINRFCSLLNRIHDEKPGLLNDTLSKIMSSMDGYEIGETTRWVTEDIVQSVKPVANEILPPIIRGLADLLSSQDKNDQGEIMDAIEYFKERVNIKGVKS